MEIYNFPQYSDEWWKIREKRLTASHAQAIGNCGAGLKTYVQEKMSELYKKDKGEKFFNKHTQRGIDLEPSAGTAYSFDYNVSVQKVGFVVYNDYVGCSPDLFVEEKGLGEIKCLDDKGHFALILGGEFESIYIWQCQAQMLICEKEWCDLLSYNPNYDKYLVVKRIKPEPKKIEKLKAGFELGEKMMNEIAIRMKCNQ